MKLLEDICKASTPRFVDEENLRDQFKARLDMFYDVGSAQRMTADPAPITGESRIGRLVKGRWRNV